MAIFLILALALGWGLCCPQAAWAAPPAEARLFTEAVKNFQQENYEEALEQVCAWGKCGEAGVENSQRLCRCACVAEEDFERAFGRRTEWRSRIEVFGHIHPVLVVMRGLYNQKQTAHLCSMRRMNRSTFFSCKPPAAPVSV